MEEATWVTILVLHGARPAHTGVASRDAINDICERAVEITFSLHAPAFAADPRPCPGDRCALLAFRAEPRSRTTCGSPHPVHLDANLGQRGIGGLALLRPLHVGHRLSGGLFGAAHLVREFADPVLPVGDLEQGCGTGIEGCVESTPSFPHRLPASGTLRCVGSEVAKPAAARDEDKSTKDIGDVIEAYLALQVSRAKAEELESVQRASSSMTQGTPSKPDTLRRARPRRSSPGAKAGPATPRHRA